MATGLIPDTTQAHSHTAPGSDTQVIFNDAGTLAGDAGLTYNKTTDALTVVGPLASGDLTISKTTPQIQLQNTALAGSPSVYLGMYAATNDALLQVTAGKDIVFYNGQYALRLAGPGGTATLSSLTGTGTRVVEVSSTGVLSATNRKDRDLIYDSGLTASVVEIIVQGIFTSAYRDYEIDAGELQTSAAANIHMRQYSGASPVTGNVHYGHVCAGYNTTATIQTAVYSPATQWHLWLASGTIIVNGRMSIRVSGPAIATGTTIYGTVGASFSAGGAWGLFGGTHQAATAYDGFGIFPGSGTIVGRVKVYGVR